MLGWAPDLTVMHGVRWKWRSSVKEYLLITRRTGHQAPVMWRWWSGIRWLNYIFQLINNDFLKILIILVVLINHTYLYPFNFLNYILHLIFFLLTSLINLPKDLSRKKANWSIISLIYLKPQVIKIFRLIKINCWQQKYLCETDNFYDRWVSWQITLKGCVQSSSPT